jgi:hypothetical protein
VLRSFGVLIGAGLLVGAIWLIVTGTTTKQQQIGVLVGLWGLLVAAFAAFGARRPEFVAAGGGAELALRESGRLDRAADAAVAREYEHQLRAMIRQEIHDAFAGELNALRHEVAALRSEVVDKVGGQLRLERIETTRVIGSDIEALQAEVRQLQSARRAETEARRLAQVRDAVDAEVVDVGAPAAPPVTPRVAVREADEPEPDPVADPVDESVDELVDGAVDEVADAADEPDADAAPDEVAPQAAPRPQPRPAWHQPVPAMQWSPPPADPEPAAAAEPVATYTGHHAAPEPDADYAAAHHVAGPDTGHHAAQHDPEDERFWPWAPGDAESAGGADPFASMPRIRPFTDFELEPAGGPANRPSRRSSGEAGEPARSGGRRRRDSDDDNDVLARILQRERGNGAAPE